MNGRNHLFDCRISDQTGALDLQTSAGMGGGDGLELDCTAQGATLVVTVRGELDLVTAETFRQQVDAALDRTRARSLHLHLARVTFMDSSGLGAILGRYRRLRQSGGRMVLISPSPAIRPVVELAGLHKLMEIHESEAAGTAG